MFELKEKIVNISWHADSIVLAGTIPFDVHAHQLLPCHVDLHTKVILEKNQKMVEVFKSNVFDTKNH